MAANVNCSVSAAFVQMDGFTGAVLQTVNDTVPLNWSYNITPPAYLSVDPVCIVSDDYYNPSSSYTPYFGDALNAGARRGAVMATDAAGTQLVWASIVSVGRRYDYYPMGAARSTLLVRHINLTTGAARTVLSANVSGDWLLGMGFPATAAIAASDQQQWAAAGLVDMVFTPGSAGRQGDSVLLLPRYTPVTAALYGFPLGSVPLLTVGHAAPIGLRVDLATGACIAVPLGLGTPLLGIAFDELTPQQPQPPQQTATTPAGAADSGRLQQQQQQPAAAYLLYADTSPVSVDACDPRGAGGVLHSGALTQPPSSTSLCFPHYVLREQQHAQAQAQQSQQPRRQQSVLQMEFTQKYPTSLFTSPYASSVWSPGGLTEVPILALNRAPSSTATAAAAAAATPPVYLYLADRDRCQVRRLDPLTGASAVVAGYDGSSSSSSGSSSSDGLQRRSFLCSFTAQDGPALGQPMGRPGRITRGAPGTVFVLEDWQQPPGAVPLRIRRISGV